MNNDQDKPANPWRPNAPEPIVQFFAHAHLPPHLAAISAPFSTLADLIVATLPRNPERTVALRKLLESKDAAVRAKLFKDGSRLAPADPNPDARSTEVLTADGGGRYA